MKCEACNLCSVSVSLPLLPTSFQNHVCYPPQAAVNISSHVFHTCVSSIVGHFKAASDWIMNNQDKNGGWSVVVKRTVAKLVLEPGW